MQSKADKGKSQFYADFHGRGKRGYFVSTRRELSQSQCTRDSEQIPVMRSLHADSWTCNTALCLDAGYAWRNGRQSPTCQRTAPGLLPEIFDVDALPEPGLA